VGRSDGAHRQADGVRSHERQSWPSKPDEVAFVRDFYTLDAREAPQAAEDLLGHATIQMTMRYAHLAPEVARDAVRLLDMSETRGKNGDKNRGESRHLAGSKRKRMGIEITDG
jgi:hypothetical protein